MKTRWQDWMILILGVWLVLSPFWMAGYASAVSTAAWNSYVLGVAVAIFAAAALANPRRWEEWFQLALAIWLIISPFVLLFFDNENGAAWNTMFVGALIGVDAVSILVQRPAVPA